LDAEHQNAELRPSPPPSPGVPGEGEMPKPCSCVQRIDGSHGSGPGRESEARPCGTAAKRVDVGDRPLRVGFVSPDIREHPVARLLEPILRHLDRERFETFCYSDERRGDKLTGRIKALAQNWRDTGGMPDAKLVKMIRGARIDVLVDLAGHMGANRLPMFGRRLAPVQVTHFNYPDTTGIPEMDWRISDDLAEPSGVADAHDRYSVERLMRLPKRAWCYQPTEDGPAVGPLPALRNGYVTFTSLNKPIKHSPPCVAL
jgi:protein O-GlcNAc transferase